MLKKLKSTVNPWLKLFIQTFPGPRMKHMLLTPKALCLRKFRQHVFRLQLMDRKNYTI